MAIAVFPVAILAIMLAAAIGPPLDDWVGFGLLGVAALCAIFAIVIGHRGRALARASNGQQRSSMATAGLATAYSVVGLFAFFFLLGLLITSFVDDSTTEHSDTESIAAGTSVLVPFEVPSGGGVANYTFTVLNATTVDAAIVRATSLDSPHSVGTATWAATSGTSAKQSAILGEGVYALQVHCVGPRACRVAYTVHVEAGLPDTLHRTKAIHDPACGLAQASTQMGPDRLPAWQPPTSVVPTQGSYLYVHGTSGDYIFGGQDELFQENQTRVSFAVKGTSISFAESVESGAGRATWWNGQWVPPKACQELAPGYFPGMTRYPFNDASTGGLDFSGSGRGCNTIKGSMIIDAVEYDAERKVARVEMRFEQHCEGGGPYLIGKYVWDRGY